MRPRTGGDRPYRVAVIGAGFAGIAVGHFLRRAGFDDFVIYEREKSPGGTWFVNQYPGAACDTESHQYSLSFVPWSWSRTHATQPELLSYLEYAVDQESLRDKICLGQEVHAVTWDDATSRYEVRSGFNDVESYDAVVTSVGFFNVPSIPDWPGLDRFTGRVVHSARWPDGLDVAGLRVGVVGTGSSSAQLVPALAESAREVVVFQRSPGWILPKYERNYTSHERATLRGMRRARLRMRLFRDYEKSIRQGGRRAGTKQHQRRQSAAVAFIGRELAERPDLIPLVTPDYPLNGKRTVRSDTFYRALCRSNVRLVSQAVVDVRPNSVIDGADREHEIDVLVLATGFHASSYLAGLEVFGRNGCAIHERWAGEPEAFLGLSVPDFPNFFMMYGPNTNSGPLVFLLEAQARAIAKVLRRARRSGSVVETRQSISDRYNAWLQRQLRATVWTTTHNYYQSASGKVVTQWPLTATLYRALLRVLWAPSMRYRRASAATHSAS